jgi:hypothetical protein
MATVTRNAPDAVFPPIMSASWVMRLSCDMLIEAREGGQLNQRQEKTWLRMVREGPEGLAAGFSAGKYARITGACPATATRDLAELVTKGALLGTGERKHTCYQIGIPRRSMTFVVMNERGEVV